jgi:hypothetical protein
MDHFFKNDEYDDINKTNFNEKISLDELYDRKREVEINRMNIYRKILNRVHNKIKTVSRQKCETQLFYVIPEFIFGVPKYNVNTCISYIVEKLEENGFLVKYTHPNLLFISWGHYIPAYKREQIKKETGVSVDGFGNIVKKKNNSERNNNDLNLDPSDPKSLMMSLSNKNHNNKSGGNSQQKKDYKSIDTYKPSGIYNLDLLQRIKDKTS